MHAQDAHTPTPHPFCLTLTCPSERDRSPPWSGSWTGAAAMSMNWRSSTRASSASSCAASFTAAQPLELDALKRDFADIAARFDMSWQVYDLTRRPRVVIMVSKLDHCLADLLFRWRMNELRMDIAAIVSNHPDLLPGAGTRDRLPPPARHAADQARAGSPAAAAGRGQRRGPGGAGALHAGAVARRHGAAGGPGHQHPPFVPARLQGRAPLSPGLRTRRQTDRGHRALRDRGSGRRPHHRTDGGPRGPQLRPAQLLAAGRDMECVGWRGPCGCISNAASSSTTTGRWCCSRRRKARSPPAPWRGRPA